MTLGDLHRKIEKEHSKRNTAAIARWIGADRRRFALLMELFLNGDRRTVQRSSWILSCCVENHPELLLPWLTKVVDRASHSGIHNAVQRNVVRSLQFLAIPRRHQGRIANLCFQFLQSAETPVSVKAFSMTVLANIAAEEPDLKREIGLIIEEMLPYGSAGIRSRGHRILNRLGGATTIRRSAVEVRRELIVR